MRAIFFASLIGLSATALLAQSVTPPTAVQAAKLPQFAAKLAIAVRTARPVNASRLPAQPRASYKTPTNPRTWFGHGGPLDSTDLYDNGPINGTVDAWTINFGFATSDSFPVSPQNTVNGMSFAAWLFPGDVLESVEISITSSEFGGTTYFDQVVNSPQSSCNTNQLGFTVCTESGDVHNEHCSMPEPIG